MNKYILIIIFVCCKIIVFGQVECKFGIVDTVSSKKAYLVIYQDTLLQNNTKYRNISFFIEKTSDLKQLLNNDLMNDSFSLYLPLSSLKTQLIINKKTEFLKSENNKSIRSKLKVYNKRVYGQYTVYSVKSTNGFIRWRLSKEDFNNSRSIEQLHYLGNNFCKEIYSPLTN
jgi:hypothetical protein